MSESLKDVEVMCIVYGIKDTKVAGRFGLIKDELFSVV